MVVVGGPDGAGRDRRAGRDHQPGDPAPPPSRWRGRGPDDLLAGGTRPAGTRCSAGCSSGPGPGCAPSRSGWPRRPWPRPPSTSTPDQFGRPAGDLPGDHAPGGRRRHRHRGRSGSPSGRRRGASTTGWTPTGGQRGQVVAAEAGQRVVLATQHLHGGMGADIDYPIHRYFLWGKQIELMLGPPSAQLARLGPPAGAPSCGPADRCRHERPHRPRGTPTGPPRWPSRT